MSDDPTRGLAALYPSATPDAPAVTPGTATTPKAAAASPTTSPATTAPPAKATWQAQDGTTPAQPATAAQPEPAGLFVEPIKTMEEAAAATPIPDGDAANFDQGEEGRQARAAIRSAFISAGASKEETGELWNMAVEAVRPDYQPQTYEAAEHDLRAAWGADFPNRLNRARNFMREVARKHPSIVPEIKALGLDVNAKFVAAVERAARRRGR